MKKLFFMSCFTAIALMSSCTTDSIDETTNTINTDNIVSTPNTAEHGDDTKDKDKGNN